MRRLLFLFALLSLLTACGSKGSLYLPPAEKPADKADVKSKQ